jgi:hypothetical protein
MVKRLSAPVAASLAAAVVVASTSAVAGCGTGSSDTPNQVGDRLTQIAARAGRPIYYLGDRFRDWPLTEVHEESGRIYLIYG